MDAEPDPAMNSDTDSEPVVEPDSNSPGLLATPVSISTQPGTRPEFIPFTTPHLCSAVSYDYHERGFYDFPERQRWMFQYNHEKDTHPMRSHRRRRVPQDMVEKRPCDPIKLKCYRVDGGDARLADLVAFLQAWLFFGVLAEISATCGLSIDIEREFLVDGTHVSTAALNGLAQRWVEAARMQASGDLKMRIERVSWILTYATSLLHFGDSRHIQVRKLSYPEVKALFAIEIAFRVAVLALEMSGVYDDEKLKDFRFGLLAGFPLPLREISAFAREELLEKGWCKSEIAMIDSVAGVDPDAPPYHFFAAALERGNMDHTKCEKVKCLADQIDENTYEPVHVEVGCQCAAEYGLVSVSGEDLRAVLEEGNVPRISISDDLELTVVRDHPYVAISHVCKSPTHRNTYRTLTSVTTARVTWPREPIRKCFTKMPNPSASRPPRRSQHTSIQPRPQNRPPSRPMDRHALHSCGTASQTIPKKGDHPTWPDLQRCHRAGTRS